MDMSKLKANKDGYIVDEQGEKVPFYTCDPAKNCLCDKAMCRAKSGVEDEGEIGFCSSTPEPAFQKDGTKPFYKKLNEDGYFGREYIGEVGQS